MSRKQGQEVRYRKSPGPWVPSVDNRRVGPHPQGGMSLDTWQTPLEEAQGGGEQPHMTPVKAPARPLP